MILLLSCATRWDGPPCHFKPTSRRSGIPASTVRYYEERGFIDSIGRRGLRRLFERGVMARLALIRLGRSAGFSLDEIAQMAPDGPIRLDRRRLAAKADELDETIRRLKAVRDGLRHAAACPAPSHIECPTFQGLLRAAAAGGWPGPGISRTGGTQMIADVTHDDPGFL